MEESDSTCMYMPQTALAEHAFDWQILTHGDVHHRIAADTECPPSDLQAPAPAFMLDGDPYRDIQFIFDSDPYRESPDEMFRSTCMREEDIAPRLPRRPDYDYPLQLTTLLLNSPACGGAWNPWKLLLDFLHAQPDFQVIKVNLVKYRVRAATLKGHSCEFKVFVYKEQPKSVAIEFQKRSGDTMAFDRVFRRAAEHLGGRTGPEPRKVTEGGMWLPPVPRSPGLASEELELRPLLDLATHTDQPHLLAEVVVGLNAAFEAVSDLDTFCTPEVLQVLRQLLGLRPRHTVRPAGFTLAAHCEVGPAPAKRADWDRRAVARVAAAAGYLLVALAERAREAQQFLEDGLLEDLHSAAQGADEEAPVLAAAREAARAATRSLSSSPVAPSTATATGQALSQLADLRAVVADFPGKVQVYAGSPLPMRTVWDNNRCVAVRTAVRV